MNVEEVNKAIEDMQYIVKYKKESPVVCDMMERNIKQLREAEVILNDSQEHVAPHTANLLESRRIRINELTDIIEQREAEINMLKADKDSINDSIYKQDKIIADLKAQIKVLESYTEHVVEVTKRGYRPVSFADWRAQDWECNKDQQK